MTDEQERAELLPCPFCGEHPKLVYEGRVGPGPELDSIFKVKCECGASIESRHYAGFREVERKQEVVEKWNRRAALQSQTEKPFAPLEEMNTHDIELPPLPDAEAYLYVNKVHRGVSLQYRGDAELPEGAVRFALITTEQADDRARAAIEADRKRGGEPSGYAYRYRHYDGGTVIRFNDGCEVNGSRPIEALPYWFAPQPAEPDVLPGEAIFGFAAWLTSLKTPVTFSECHGAAVGTDLAAAYNTSQGFYQVREDFHKRLKPYPKDEPPQPAEPVKEIELRAEDLHISTYSPTPRPQWAAHNDRGVRIVHLPTGTVAESHEERSPHRNREIALDRLRQSIAAGPVRERPETTSEHIARGLREGRFPDKSERQTIPAEPVAEVQVENDYWSRGHFHQGRRKVLKVISNIQDLPSGTKLYTS